VVVDGEAFAEKVDALAHVRLHRCVPRVPVALKPIEHVEDEEPYLGEGRGVSD
jgi:hypothetical protein